MLEETPEFLQETPEHDRLWFEQKPPRDFDLDDSRAPLHPAGRLHRPAAGRQRARGRTRRRRDRRRGDARLRARDEAVGDLVRPVAGPEAERADYRHRIFMMSGEIPFAGHPSLGVAAAVARARGERSASYVQQTQPGEQAIDVELDGLRERVDAPGAADVRAGARSRRGPRPRRA